MPDNSPTEAQLHELTVLDLAHQEAKARWRAAAAREDVLDRLIAFATLTVLSEAITTRRAMT